MIEIIYYTGDLHGDVDRIDEWIRTHRFTDATNYLLQQGDAGINYYLDSRDVEKKEKLRLAISSLKEKNKELKILFVRGNHDCRPEKVESYKLKSIFGAQAYIEAEYPELVFLKDSSIYTIDEQRFFVLGGGYSKDFFGRILRGDGFWFDEQMSDEEFAEGLGAAEKIEDDVIVLSHSLPRSISPNGYDSYSMESRTEYYLDIILSALSRHLKKWIAGHYHTNWTSEDQRFEIVYESVKTLSP